MGVWDSENTEAFALVVQGPVLVGKDIDATLPQGVGDLGLAVVVVVISEHRKAAKRRLPLAEQRKRKLANMVRLRARDSFEGALMAGFVLEGTAQKCALGPFETARHAAPLSRSSASRIFVRRLSASSRFSFSPSMISSGALRT